MAVVREAAHEGKRLHRFLVGQHRGRLVQDEDAGAEQQNLEDLDALLLGDGERADDGVGVDLEAHVGIAFAVTASAASRGRRTPSAARQASTMFSATVKRCTSL